MKIDGRVFFKNAAGGLLVKLGNVAINTAVTVLLTNSLGVDQYGQYVIVVSFLTILAAFSHLGFPQLLLREAARYRSLGDRDLPAIVRRAHLWVLLFVLLAYGVGYLFFLPKVQLTNLELIYLGLPILALTVVGRLRSSTVRGLGWVVAGQLPESIFRPSLLLAALFFFGRLMNQEIAARDAIVYYLGASTVAFLFGSWLLQRSLRSRRAPNGGALTENPGSSELLRFAFYVGLGSSFQLLIGNVEALFLGSMRGSSDVGLYKVALTLAFLIFAVEQALNSVATPRISALVHKGEHQELKLYSSSTARLTFGLSAVVYVSGLVVGNLVISTVFGNEFSYAYRLFVVIGAGMLSANLFGPVLQLLVMSGLEKLSLAASLLAVGLNFALNILLIDLVGAMGAAIATAISFFVWKLVMSLFVRRRIGKGYSAIGW